MSLRQMFDDFHTAGENNEHTITGLAFPHNDVAGTKGSFFHGKRNLGQCGGIKPGENRDTFQKILARFSSDHNEGVEKPEVTLLVLHIGGRLQERTACGEPAIRRELECRP
jgi:hypothetical protein